MDNPSAYQGEHHQEDGPVLLASIVVEGLAEVLARREGKGYYRPDAPPPELAEE
jgi:hypothetical protein